MSMVGVQGIEPRMPKATDLQSAEVTNASRHPLILVPDVRIELTANALSRHCSTTELIGQNKHTTYHIVLRMSGRILADLRSNDLLLPLRQRGVRP